MKWPWGHRLARLVRRQENTLEIAFGTSDYAIVDLANDCCAIEGPDAIIQIERSWRDEWLASSIRFAGLSEPIPTDTLLQFLGLPESVPVRGPLSEIQVRGEVAKIAAVLVQFRSDPAKIEKAAHFFQKECEELTRKYSA